MDSLIAAAARALSAGDALGALKRVSLRDDPPALALRGIAMAQQIARADRANALHARLIAVRRMLLLGRLDEAASALALLDTGGLPQSMIAVAELTAAEVALRTLRTAPAHAALVRAHDAAFRAGVPALIAEVAEVRASLERPAARRLHAGANEQQMRLDEVEALLRDPGALVLDACRRGLRAGDAWLPLARRPVLFALACALAEAWPGDVDRNTLIERAFRTRRPDETHRARLRVEIGRLRALAAPLARIEATERGFALVPQRERAVAVLVPPIDGEQASLLALLADGAAWSTSALALALDDSQRTVQRALVELEEGARVRSIGRARAQRWLSSPLAGFTTILLLPAALPDA